MTRHDPKPHDALGALLSASRQGAPLDRAEHGAIAHALDAPDAPMWERLEQLDAGAILEAQAGPAAALSEDEADAMFASAWTAQHNQTAAREPESGLKLREEHRAVAQRIGRQARPTRARGWVAALALGALVIGGVWWWRASPDPSAERARVAGVSPEVIGGSDPTQPITLTLRQGHAGPDGVRVSAPLEDGARLPLGALVSVTYDTHQAAHIALIAVDSEDGMRVLRAPLPDAAPTPAGRGAFWLDTSVFLYHDDADVRVTLFAIAAPAWIDAKAWSSMRGSKTRAWFQGVCPTCAVARARLQIQTQR